MGEVTFTIVFVLDVQFEGAAAVGADGLGHRLRCFVPGVVGANSLLNMSAPVGHTPMQLPQ